MPNDVPSPDSTPLDNPAAAGLLERARLPRDLVAELQGIDLQPWQRSLRWQPIEFDRRIRVAGIVAGILACILQWVGFGFGMGAGPMKPEIRHDKTVQVSLITPAEELPIPPEPEPPPFERRTSAIRVEPPKAEKRPPPPPTSEPADEDSMKARIGSEGAPSLRLFNPDGTVRIGTPPPARKEAPLTPREKARVRWAELQKRGQNPLDCQRTRFASAYAPDLSLGDSVASKYLKYIGLADMQVIKHNAQKREARAAAGCD